MDAKFYWKFHIFGIGRSALNYIIHYTDYPSFLCGKDACISLEGKLSSAIPKKLHGEANFSIMCLRCIKTPVTDHND
jgi:hypothetical protein